MTRVCLVGAEEATLPEDLLAYPKARDTLDAYELESPYENAIAVETISIGAAVSLLNDLDWYLVRLVEEALVLEPSVSTEEWLSRALATDIRNETVEPEDTGELLKIYGVEFRDAEREDADAGPSDSTASSVDSGEAGAAEQPSVTREPTGPPRLVEPLFARRVDGEVPEYDLRDVEDALVVRVTPHEFGA